MSSLCRYCRVIHKPLRSTIQEDMYYLRKKSNEDDSDESSKRDEDVNDSEYIVKNSTGFGHVRNSDSVVKDSTRYGPQNGDNTECLVTDKHISAGIQTSIHTNRSTEDFTHLNTTIPTKQTPKYRAHYKKSGKQLKKEGSGICSKVSQCNGKHLQRDMSLHTTRFCEYPKPSETLEDKKTPRMNWNQYHRLAVIHEFMNNLENKFPSICTVGSIGKSIEGRELKILRISNSHASNASVWVDAGIHAREWIAPAVATFIANHIANNFSKLPTSITNKDWYFLPVMNPDGYEHSHTGNRMWRKNRAWHNGQCVGVDLNRNFSFGWGGRGSSDIPTNAFFRGPQPFSEPESSAVKDFILNAGIHFTLYLTLHSFGQIIILPYAHQDQLCPDYIRLLEGATVMSKAIYETSGNIYKVGISKDVMYHAAGTSADWSHGEAKIPYSYLIELRSKKHKFKLPKEEIEETGNEILNCVKALMEFIDGYNSDKRFAGDGEK